ncbi:MAG: hypothetical protein MI923_17560 [Phycisphaerales bacterium]|nr:hypothetical protein [Phycisphaerales bacterium]
MNTQALSRRRLSRGAEVGQGRENKVYASLSEAAFSRHRARADSFIENQLLALADPLRLI